MAKFPEHFLRQVQQSIDIVDLVGRYVNIKRRGKDFLGLCPFHEEKTPSFSVSPTKQIYKCFGCGAGGGVFQFVMKHQNLSFPEAVEFLAEQAGIPIEKEGGPVQHSGPDRGSLFRLMDFARSFYFDQLKTSQGKAALDYAYDRGLNDETIERFQIGFAPDSWDQLTSAARAAGFSDNQLITAGLAAERNTGGCYDRFRNRLLFPINDQSGRVVAFGGRALSPDERAKYLNSPETPLFDKSSNLYGLDLARRDITSSDCVIVVEGYLDVVMPCQYGVRNIVATLGTALTARHVRMLSRMAADVVLLFDSDSAGQAAAERGLELFISQQINVRIAAVPDGKDPCDFVLSNGGDQLKELVANAPDAIEFIWASRAGKMAPDADLVTKNRAVDDFLALLAQSSAYGAIDQMRQGLLINRLSHLLGVPAESVSQRLTQMARKIPTSSGNAPQHISTGANPARANSALGYAGCQRRILETLIAQPELFEFAARTVSPQDFTDPLLAAVAKMIWQLGDSDELSLEALLAVEASEQWGSMIIQLHENGCDRGNYESSLGAELAYVEHLRHRREVEQLKSRSDDDALRKLTEKARKGDSRRRPF